jgi:hypothetical protein
MAVSVSSRLLQTLSIFKLVQVSGAASEIGGDSRAEVRVGGSWDVPPQLPFSPCGGGKKVVLLYFCYFEDLITLVTLMQGSQRH